MNCPCYGNGTCNYGLKCRSNICRIIEPASDGDLDALEGERGSEADFDEVELSDSDLDNINNPDGDLDGNSENRGFENDEDSNLDGDLDSEFEEQEVDHQQDEDRSRRGQVCGVKNLTPTNYKNWDAIANYCATLHPQLHSFDLLEMG